VATLTVLTVLTVLATTAIVPQARAVASPPEPAASAGTLGYGLVDTSGVVSTFGSAAYFGDEYDRPLAAPVVGAAATTDHRGYWLVATDGGIFAFGDARYLGSMGGRALRAPIVAMAADPRSGGYWMVAADGGVFGFGGAPYRGSMGGRPLEAPIVGMAADPATGGYWLVASDGGVFGFGGAPYRGSMGGRPLRAPVVAMASDPATGGYWLVASDGGVFTFGGAPYVGSTGALTLAAPVDALLATADGAGYWLVAADGGVFTFGDARYQGSASDPLHPPLYTDNLSEHPVPTVAGLLVATGIEAARTGPERLEMMGDSLAFDTAYGLAAMAGEDGAVSQNSAIGGCGLAGPADDVGVKWAHPTESFAEWPACREWAQRDEAALAATHPDAVALLAGYWESQRWYRNGVLVDLADPAYAAQVSQELLEFAHLVRGVGAQPVFVTAPYFDDGTPNGLVDVYNTLVRQAAASDGGDPVVDLHQLLDPQNAYASTVDGVAARLPDGVHLTPQGAAEVVAPYLLGPLVDAGAAAHQ
jgi:hypothetical protein